MFGLLRSVHAWWIELHREKSLGDLGEDAAARFLERLGYTIVARGYRDRLGELDLVAVDERTVVFVEVKTRRSHEAGHPFEAITFDKQRRLTRLARAFIQKHELERYSSRFDVVAVTWPDKGEPQIEHVINAFEAVS